MITELHDNTIDPQLIDWLASFDHPVEALGAIAQLFGDLDGQAIKGTVDECATVRGPVRIGQGSHIHPHVTIDGPVIIGDNVSVRPGAQIRNHAYIGSNCVIGHGADIKRSICLNGAKMQDGTFVGDSVLGVGARVGSGSILANRKFNQANIKYATTAGEVLDSGLDFFGAILGRYVRLGANSVLSPGTVIGEHTWVGSGCVLHGTYAADQLITVKQTLNIRDKDRVPLKSGIGEYEHI